MADSPKEAEAAQALFCAVADMIGYSKVKKEFVLSKLPNFKLFKEYYGKTIDEAYKGTDTPQITKDQIEKFLIEKEGWYESSLKTAVKLMDEITTISSKFSKIKAPKLQDIVYVRGAAKQKGRKSNAMENISALFDIANKNEKQYFGDINKWSPADIYFVSTKAEKEILNQLNLAMGELNKSYGFVDLNSITSKLIDSGDLLPLSLKKVLDDAKIVKVNFLRSKEEEYLSKIEYYGVSDWSKKYTKDKPITRDIKIYFSKDKKDKLKIRHDAYSKTYGTNKAVKCEIEVTGAGGRGGSVVGIELISKIISKVDKQFANEIKRAFDSGFKKYTLELQKMNKEYQIKSGTKLQSPAKEAYDNDRATLSGLYVANAIMPVIYKWFKNNENNNASLALNRKVVQKFIEYTSSRTIKSGKFVIAK